MQQGHGLTINDEAGRPGECCSVPWAGAGLQPRYEPFQTVSVCYGAKEKFRGAGIHSLFDCGMGGSVVSWPEGMEFTIEKHAAVARFDGAFDEEALEAWAAETRQELDGPVSLGVVFMAPPYFERAEEVLEIVRINAQTPVLAGCSSHGLIAGGSEIEANGGLVLALYYLPEAELKAFYLTPEDIEYASGADYWPEHTGVKPEESNGWMILADPFHLKSDSWLEPWNAAYAPLPIVGGLASGALGEQESWVYLNGQAYDSGAVAISVGGAVELASAISQGCTPIGETWTITKVDRNLILEAGSRPAYEVLGETFEQLGDEAKKRARNNLFAGLVIDEYREEFHRGDFLVRNLLGADPKSGAIAVGAYPRVGQTMQFQFRDAEAALDDMRFMLTRMRDQLDGELIYGGCLFACSGQQRGFSGSRTRMRGWCRSYSDRWGSRGSSATARSGRWGTRASCTATRLRWRCLCGRADLRPR